MAAKKEWFAYRHILKITRTVRGKRPEESPLGVFFPTWKKAHAFIVDNAHKRAVDARKAARKAQSDAQKAEAFLKQAKAMVPMKQVEMPL